MIVMTVDTEWSPDPVIRDLLELFEDFGVSATVFSTHDDTVCVGGHERALHPNFFRDGETEHEALSSVADHYPDAEGVRSHGMYVHSSLRDLYPEFGLRYESNYMQYLVDEIDPFWMYDEIVQFPVYFMDDMWLRTRATLDDLPDPGNLLGGDGLKVFDFHPVHVYLNTPTIGYYERRKDHYDDPNRLRAERADGPGVRDLLQALLSEIEAGGYETATLGDIATQFQQTNDPEGISL